MTDMALLGLKKLCLCYSAIYFPRVCKLEIFVPQTKKPLHSSRTVTQSFHRKPLKKHLYPPTLTSKTAHLCQRQRAVLKTLICRALVAHSCNPSYSGGSDQEDCSSKPTWANSLTDPISKNPSQKTGLVECPKVKALSSNPCTPEPPPQKKILNPLTVERGDSNVSL
jgi:hypothetical protein